MKVNEFGALICPRCGEETLHHSKIIVRNRIAEDEPGTQYEIGKREFKGMAIETGFAGRRDDIEIFFWCEGCSGDEEGLIDETKDFSLSLKQHKGSTLVAWNA